MPRKKKKKNMMLRLHPNQATVFNDPARYKVLCCSRRWGKSRLLMTILITKAINFKGHYDPLSPSVCALIMPTLKQARSIHWNALVAALDGHPAVDKIHKSDFRISLKGNRPDIILRGCNEDSGDSLRGSKFYFAAFDEIQDVKDIVWTEVVSPALADTAGSTAFFCGCVNPNTLVLTDSGFERIGKLDPGTKPKQWKELNIPVWGIGKDFHNADGFWNNGFEQTLIVTTDSGYSIEATYNHPVLTRDGWVKLEDLDFNSEIAIDFGMDKWGNTTPGKDFELGFIAPEHRPTKKLEFNLEMAYMLGYFSQKAHWIKNDEDEKIGFRFNPRTKSDDRDYFRSKSIGGFRFRDSSSTEWHGRPLIMESLLVIKWLEHLGVDFDSPVHHREVPDWLLKANKELVCSYLKGLYDANGSPLRKNGKTLRRVNLYSRSQKFMQQIQIILLNLGIVSRLTESDNRDKVSADVKVGNKKYLLAVRGEYFKPFKKYIGFKRASFTKEVRKLRNSKEGCRFKVDTEYFWDRIVTIKQSASPTVDFTVPNTKSFLGNGIICHNTPKGIGTFFHQLYKNEEIGLKGWKSFHQTIYDNPFIAREEIANFEAALPPKAFEQEFLASWVSFEGQIFSELSEHNLVKNDAVPAYFDEMILGIDWGDINPALVVVGYKNGIYFLVDYWENPNPKYAIEQRHHDEAAVRFCEKYPITSSFADPSQPGRIMTMRRAGVPLLRNGYNRVSEGNGIINTLLFQKRLLIKESTCERPYEVMTAYHRKKKDGVIFDEPELHQDDHLADALRYVIASREHKNFAQDNFGQRLLVAEKPNLILPEKQGLYT